MDIKATGERYICVWWLCEEYTRKRKKDRKSAKKIKIRAKKIRN